MKKPLQKLEEIEFRCAEHRDLEGIVNCHNKEFVGQFMTEMGPRWLKEKTCIVS